MPTHTIQPPEWIDAAPIRVEAAVEVDVPPAAAWARISDHASWPEWFTTLDRVEPVGSGEGVGGERLVTVKRLTLDEEFTAWDVDRHFAFAVISSKLLILETLAESVRIEPTPAGCRIVYRQGLQAKRGFGRVLGLMWKPAAKELPVALDNLKSLLESSAP